MEKSTPDLGYKFSDSITAVQEQQMYEQILKYLFRLHLNLLNFSEPGTTQPQLVTRYHFSEESQLVG